MHATAKLAVVCLAGSGMVMAPDAGFSHGSMESPISRVYNCRLENPEQPKSDACKAVVQAGGTQPLYDWMEVNQSDANGNHKALVTDGNICAGGRDKYVGLDLERSDWVKTTVVPNKKTKVKMTFYGTTPHATEYFQTYITKANWNPDKALSWSDLKKIKKKKYPEWDGNRLSWRVKVPANREGYHVLYTVWQRSDSPEAFYTCTDVNVVWSNGISESQGQDLAEWTEVGQVIAHNDLAAGSTVTLRVFDPDGGDVASHALRIRSRTGGAEDWPAALAGLVNAESDVFNIGVLEGSGGTLDIEPESGAAANAVYLSGAYPGYTYHIDIDTPPSN